jgi:DNA-binding transcriptional regulator YdaS (Cro superfamily)
MDKQLIERVAQAMYEGHCHAGRKIAQPFDLMDQWQREMWLQAARAGATLVAEECAKVASGYSVNKQPVHPDIPWDSMSEQAKAVTHMACQNVALAIGDLFRSDSDAARNAPAWKVQIMRKARDYAEVARHGGRVGFTAENGRGERTAFQFDIHWLRTASDEDIQRAIDASEAPAFHSPPATVVPNTVPYWPRQMATRPRDPDEKG